MKPVRFYVAFYAAKSCAKVLTMLHRKATHLPGWLALRLDKDFLKYLPMPKTIIGITGTNGKTTTNNLINDILADQGIEVISNRTGSNIAEGITSALLAATSWSIHMKKDLAVLEMDERASRLYMPYVKPTYLLCTNLFRDSFRRNAHVEFIFNILNAAIPEETTLILNADDGISSRLAINNPRVYYGIARQPDEKSERNLVQDQPLCPICDHHLLYDFRRYHHIGRAHCPHCGYHSPDPDYLLKTISAEEITIVHQNQETKYPTISQNIINHYNLLGAIVVLRELGLDPRKIAASVSKLHIVESRYHESVVRGIKVVVQLTKSPNAIACSRSFDFARNYPGKKSVIIMVDEFDNRKTDSEANFWLYDTDLEFLNDDSISQIILSGERCEDFHLRLLIGGIPEEKIDCSPFETESYKLVRLAEVDTVILLDDLYQLDNARVTEDALLARIQKEVPEA